jgi:hypothetical protein
MERMAKRINFKHYIFFILIMFLSVISVGLISYYSIYFPITTKNYFSETDKIKAGLNYLINYKCTLEIEEIDEKWICEKKNFSVEKIEADRDRSYSYGTGKTKSEIEFWWIAIKNESWWNVMSFGKEDEQLECEHIPEELKINTFDGKFNFCEDSNGKIIDRFSTAL